MNDATTSHFPSNDSAVGQSEPAGPLRVAVERVGSAVVVRVGGDVDASNIATWRHLLDDVAGSTAAPGTFVVDTSALDFMAVCGFAALADTSRRCRRRGIAFCLVGDQLPLITRIIAACGWQTELPVYEDVSAALIRVLA